MPIKLCNVSGCYNYGKYCRLHGSESIDTSAQAEREYEKLRLQYLEAHPHCEVEGCKKGSDQVHHKEGRGKNLCDVKKFMAVCNPHHRKITDDPSWALAQGYSLSRLNSKI